MSGGGGGDDLRSLLQLLGWLQTAFHVAIAAAFVIFCFVRAKQVGFGGTMLLAIAGILDVAGIVIYRLGTTVVTSSHASMSSFDATFNALSMMDVVFTLISIGLVGAGYFLLRTPPLPAYGRW